MTPEKSALVIYQTDDGKTRIDVRLDNETLWLTQAQMAELFQTTKQNVSLHIKNILSGQELARDSVVKEYLTTAADGKKYQTTFYNLDAVIAVGYRVKSLRGGQYWKELLERIRRYVREEGWQVAAIEEGVRQADAGDFATEEEVKAAFAQWGVDVRTGRFSKCAA